MIAGEFPDHQGNNSENMDLRRFASPGRTEAVRRRPGEGAMWDAGKHQTKDEEDK
jgi:hypothetical protein